MAEYLNFQKISKQVSFKELLDWQNIVYKEKGKELKGQTDSFMFIVNQNKNLFFSPDLEKGGSIINFLAELKQIDLREAAKVIQEHFNLKPKRRQPTLPVYDLDYSHDWLKANNITVDQAKKFEIGYCKKGIMKGRIACLIRDENGKKIGYIGRAKDDNTKPRWLFPKNLKLPLYNAHSLPNNKWAIVVVSAIDCAYLDQFYPDRVVALLRQSMANNQEAQLAKIKMVLLFHSQPDNIVNRLAKHTFVRVITLLKPLRFLSKTEIETLIKK